MALGAATAYMDAYQAHASVAQPGGALVSYAVIMQGGIQVTAALIHTQGGLVVNENAQVCRPDRS